MSVVLVDAGGTNIGSVRYALQRLGADAALTSDAAAIRAADKAILPGVGAAGPGMARLRELGLVELLRSLTQPVLGVCLGMQLLCANSEEGDTECLGLIPASVQRFTERPGLRVPHMGWNRLSVRREHRLLAGLDEGDQAYFVHSYAAPVGEWTLATADYGDAFSAVVARGNFHGMQFHPERSAAVGAKLLKNFLEL
ncbi:MAG TPA: imidazole glycerol phosphate synthase subunit HisH [Rhodanobacter sp.]|nr:imidazole glycerol phosphate synthase subunit HisH [Rhodanobacter sp.]